MTRQIVMDTETTGLEPDAGHNIIEIGCVEMVARKLTGRTYHQYVKPDHEIDAEAMEVHGITHEFLDDKPKFREVMSDFIEFVRGAELIIHNAAFDVGFLNAELARNGHSERIEDLCSVTDSLLLARKKHPGQKNSLDALCRRYDIDNSHRELHGALLDSEILADVYLAITGGQTTLMLSSGEQENADGGESIRRVAPELAQGLAVVAPAPDELAAHEKFLDLLDKKSEGAVWRRSSEQVH